MSGSAAVFCGKAPPFRRRSNLNLIPILGLRLRLHRRGAASPSNQGKEGAGRKGRAFPQDTAAEPHLSQHQDPCKVQSKLPHSKALRAYSWFLGARRQTGMSDENCSAGTRPPIAGWAPVTGPPLPRLPNRGLGHRACQARRAGASPVSAVFRPLFSREQVTGAKSHPLARIPGRLRTLVSHLVGANIGPVHCDLIVFATQGEAAVYVGEFAVIALNRTVNAELGKKL